MSDGWFEFGMAMGAAEEARDYANACRKWKAYARALEERLALVESGADASNAVIAEFKRQHPDSPLLKRVGADTVYGTLWDKTFCAAAMKRGIQDPREHISAA